MKTRRSSQRDRLSELSDSLILHILGFLTMTDVVRTTILSKRWKNLWTTVPLLNFEYDDKINAENFVNGAVNSWRGTDNVKLNINFNSRFEKSMASAIDSLIRCASKKKVEELKLSFPYPRNVSEAENIYLVPQCLYSCLLLRVLTLKTCDLQIHGNVQLYQLKRLIIMGEGLSENSINQVLCGSPQLEYFYLTIRGSKENLSIRSSSLKWLYIGRYLFFSGENAPFIDSELRISTPKLKLLKLFGVPYSKCSLMDVSSLTQASFEFDGSCLYGSDFVGDKVCEIFPTFKLLQRVTLKDWSIKALGAMNEKRVPSPFPNAYYLELIVSSQVYEQIVGILEVFPKLRNLVLKTTCKSPPMYAERWLKFERNFSYLFLLQLRTVDVGWTKDDDSLFPLIQILLKHASKLEKLVFRENGNKSRKPWKSLFMASEKLLKMQRSSPNAELILC